MKYGELITKKDKVAVCFYDDTADENTHLKIRDLSAHTSTELAVIKVPMQANVKLADALAIKVSPTYLFYYRGSLVDRIHGNVGIEQLCDLIGVIEMF